MNKQKVNIVIGRFQPFTLGHKELVVELYKKNNLPVCILYIDNKKFDTRHPFSNDLVERCIDASFTDKEKSKYLADVPYMKVRNANIVEIGQMLYDNNLEPVLLACGTDRYNSYKKMADNPKYRDMGKLPDDFDVIVLGRDENAVSGTLVRKAIKDDDIENINKMTDYSKNLTKQSFDILIGELKERINMVSEKLVDLNEYIYIYESGQAEKSIKIRFLIKKFEDADFPDQGFKQYITNNPLFKLLPDENKNRLLELVKDIYNRDNVYAPFVGNYKNNKNGSKCIAVRGHGAAIKNGVYITNDEFNELIQLGKAGKANIFDTVRHDTSIKEDGKFIPNASQYEYLIILALNYNYYCNINKETINEFYSHYSGDNNINEQILQYYKDNKETIDNIIKPIINNNKYFNSPYYKLQNKGIKVQSWWKENGDYSKSPNITPKTDIINLTGDCRISLKKFDINVKSNNSQLMSGAYNEMLATLNTALIKSNVPKEKSKYLRYILNILKQQGGFTKNNSVMTISELKKYINTASDEERQTPEFQQLINDYKRSVKENNILTEVIVKLCNDFPAFKRELVYEAMTGYSKFGPDSLAVPNFIMLWSDVSNEDSAQSFESCKIYSIEEYVDLIVDKVSITVNFKGSGSNSWSVMRLLN